MQELSASPRERAADAARDLVVARRRRGLARDLPERAAEERVRRGLPVAEPRGAREPVVHRALVRVPELVHDERILVHHPARMQVVADRGEAGVVRLADRVAVELVQQQVEADDLRGRDRVTLARLDGPGHVGLLRARGRDGVVHRKQRPRARQRNFLRPGCRRREREHHGACELPLHVPPCARSGAWKKTARGGPCSRRPPPGSRVPPDLPGPRPGRFPGPVAREFHLKGRKSPRSLPGPGAEYLIRGGKRPGEGL